MYAPTGLATERFQLDADRFAKYLLERGDEMLGFDPDHPGGFAMAVRVRLDDAVKAGAIAGPPDVELIMYSLNPVAVMLAVRECDVRDRRPERQLTTPCFDVDEVACFGDDSFQECCRTLRLLLRKADLLLPGLAALLAAGA